MSALVLASAVRRAPNLLARGRRARSRSRPARVDEEAVKASLLAEGAPAARDRRCAGRAQGAAGLERRSRCAGPGRRPGARDSRANSSANLRTSADARTLLRRLRGKTHALITAAVLAESGTRDLAPCQRTSALRCATFSDGFLEDYLASEGEGLLGGVGCYRLEGRGLQLFSRIDGDYFAILGLPMLPLLTALRDQGIIAQ